MSGPLEFTGERFVPGVRGEIWVEHWHRYHFAARLATGRRVVDAAFGEGYGAALLATSEQSLAIAGRDDEIRRRGGLRWWLRLPFERLFGRPSGKSAHQPIGPRWWEGASRR